jgi:acyl carrier protein
LVFRKEKRMDKKEIEERIREVTSLVLNIDRAMVTEEKRFAEDLGADSLKSLELVAAFDEAFEIEMDEDGALAVKTVGDAVDFIAKYLE